MKHFYLLVFLISLSYTGFSQSKDQPTEIKYRRSSLHTMVLESDKFPQKEVVLAAFDNAPFPDKYNNHVIGSKSFNPANYALTAAEKSTLYKPSAAGTALSGASGIIIDSVNKELPLRIQKYFDSEKIANKLISKWFNRQSDGSFDYNLVAERGVFNATFLENKAAQASSDGQAILKTAGFELIPNTFVIVNKFKFYPNEPVAAAIREASKIEMAKKMEGKPQVMIDQAYKGIDAVYEKTKEGYSIFAASYLYRLVWNDSIATIFFTDMYMEKGSIDPKKKEAFDKSNLFKLEFVGDENAAGLVTFSLKEKRTEAQVITLATTRIIDNVYAKLQKKYDVFKTKTPLFTGNPITAKIGLKEGLEEGDKFEVLEQNIDPKTGVSSYNNLGTIKVSKGMIWDNRYTDGLPEISETGEEVKANTNNLDRTTFDGGKKFYPGLLIRQIK